MHYTQCTIHNDKLFRCKKNCQEESDFYNDNAVRNGCRQFCIFSILIVSNNIVSNNIVKSDQHGILSAQLFQNNLHCIMMLIW